MFDDFLWRFAWRFCDQQASQFAGWARTWPRRSPDWDMRFSEWLRREFSDLRKAKDEPTLRPDQNMFAEPLSLSHAAACFEMGIEFDPDEA